MIKERETKETPRLELVEIGALRPTQMMVGLREVARKRADWEGLDDRRGQDFLGRHMIPVVIGPKGRPYIIDNHHLTRALYEEGVREVLVQRIADFARLEPDEFWHGLDCRNWLYPYDPRGRRRGPDDLPKHVRDLEDNPFRSLAGDVRRAGGFAKETIPYAEFLWADFFRRRMPAKTVGRDYEAALAGALILARSPEARHLPGWCGIET